jgi:CyaY protein
MYCQLNLFLAKELPGSESSCRRQLALVAGLTGKRLSDGKSLDEEACWEVGWSAMDRFAASHPRPLKHCSERKGCGVIIGREEGREVEGMWFFASGYTRAMLDEAQFRRECDRALESLKQALIAAEDDSGSFEFEDNNGVMNIIFENGSSKFVVTPNTPVRQIWISAQATSYKLEWSEQAAGFVLPKTGEALIPLTERLLREHLGDESIRLG